MALVEKYQLAFDITPVPMLLVNSEGKIALANAAFCALFEYELDQLIGESVEVLVPETVRPHHPELREAYGKVPTKRSMGAGRDLYGVTQHGETIPLELGLEPVVEGGETWALVVAIDIRQRKLHEERMQMAMDAAASAMVMVDGQGRIVFSNKAATRLFGYSEEEMVDQPVEMLVPEDAKRAHPVYLGSFMSDRRARAMGLGRDLYARHRDGTRIPVEIALTPVETRTGKLVMSTIIDLTERIAANKALEEKNEELAALNTELSQFAYSASHDLKGPLLSISGLLSICIEDLEQGDRDGVLQNLEIARDKSNRNAKKVETVLKIARAGRDRTPQEAIRLGTMIQDIWGDLDGAANGVKLEMDLQHAEPITGERGALGVILENLFSNAIRYRDTEKPRMIVRIRSKDEGGMLRLSVSDNGVGIAEKNHDLVFQMFKRLDVQSGDGLGLALVKKQVERLGGTIAMTSEEREGTEFTFTLAKGEDDNGKSLGGDRR